MLYAILRLRTSGRRALVFVNSIDSGYRVKLFLDAFGIRSAVLNSELPSASRAHILSGYNRSVFDTLIATDEALMENSEGASETTETGEETAATAAAAAPVEESGKGKKRKQRKDAESAAAAAAAATTETDKLEEEKEEEGATNTAQQGTKKPKRKKDVEYGVSRGIDFKGVDLGMFRYSFLVAVVCFG